MIRFVMFDLFHTLVDPPAQDWQRVIPDVAAILGVDPAALLGAYNETWRRRQVEWSSEETVRRLAERIGGSPSPAQVTRGGAAGPAGGRGGGGFPPRPAARGA